MAPPPEARWSSVTVRRQWLSARPYARDLRVGHRARRGLRRGRSGGHEGWAPDRPTRAQPHRYPNVGNLPHFAAEAALWRSTCAGHCFFASDFPSPSSSSCARAAAGGARRAFDGKFEIPTLEESIRLVKRKSAEKGGASASTPKLAPDVPPSHRLPSKIAARRVASRGWDRPARGVHQSFETANLRYLRTRTDLPLIQLVDAADSHPTSHSLNRLTTSLRLGVSGRSGSFSDCSARRPGEAAHYADGIGPGSLPPQLEMHRGG